MCKSKMIGHGATQCYLVKVYEGLTKGDEEQKKGLNIERGLRKCHEVKEPNGQHILRRVLEKGHRHLCGERRILSSAKSL